MPTDSGNLMTESEAAADPVVMVVDDDAFVGRAIACILREARRAQVLLARDGEEALAVLQAVVPDLVLVDVNMPGMGVVELCRRLHVHPAAGRAPLYLLTGMIPGESLLAQLQPYVERILNKPPDPVELVHALDRARNME